VEEAIWHRYIGLAVAVARCKPNRKSEASWKTHTHFGAVILRKSNLKILAARIRRQISRKHARQLLTPVVTGHIINIIALLFVLSTNAYINI
ncbi:hypothetical protein ALC57_06211, partial [Trachymyrmex cornetzi]